MSEKKISGSELIELIRTSILDVAKAKGIDPYEVTKTDLLASSAVSEWMLRKSGGLAAVRKATIPMTASKVDLGAQQNAKRNRTYVSKLERQIGDEEYFLERLEEIVMKAFKANPITVSKMNKKKFRLPKGKMEREVVGFISDTHWGLDIIKEEIPANEANWIIAARRMGAFAEQLASFKKLHRDETKTLHIVVGGDVAQGIIHLSDSGTKALALQVVGATHILVEMIDYLRTFYHSIKVHMVSCNHLRRKDKSPVKATSQKWDSYATMIYAGVQMAFRSAKDVTFNVPKTPWADFEVMGHRVFATHGDTVFSVGYPSNSIDVKKINDKINALNATAIERGEKPYSIVMVGHIHTPSYTVMPNGVHLVTNGTGSGTDSYAQSIGILKSIASQVMFESVEDYPVGDFRVVNLNKSSYDARFEEIVTPYDESIELSKSES